MVAELSLPDHAELGIIRICRHLGYNDRINNCELPGNKSGDCKSCEKFEKLNNQATSCKPYAYSLQGIAKSFLCSEIIFKTAFRNLRRNKIFTFINITGLAVGIAVCLAIFLIIQFELSFDNFHKNKSRIYRILTELHDADGIRHSRGVPFPLPTAMHNDFPLLKSSAVYSGGDDQIVIPNETNGATLKKFKEEDGVFFVEPTFFEIFDFPLLAGDYRSLKDPNTVIVTKETAETLFSAIGARL
jgi:hypothetical protein